MTDARPDPLDVLHQPAQPVRPDPTFAARLRAEVERALTAPGGPTMSTTELAGTEPVATTALPTLPSRPAWCRTSS